MSKKTISAGLTLVFALIAIWAIVAHAAEEEKTAKPEKERKEVRGQVSAIDAEAKTFTVQSQEAATTFKVTEKTKVVRLNEISVADLKSGQTVHISGETSADQSSITAKEITVIADTKSDTPAKVSKLAARGTLIKEGDNLSLDLGEGKKLSILLTDKTRVAKQIEAKFEDIKQGDRVIGRGIVEGDTVIAVHVIILPAKQEHAAPKQEAGKG